MLEVDGEQEKIAEGIVEAMVGGGVAEKKVYLDEEAGQEYRNLITPGAFDKRLIVIAVLGYPERVGVWSYTLLAQGRVDESSMEGYFREFGESGVGLVAIDPNVFGPDMEGVRFVYQLDRVVADIGADAKIGFIGFSMGGKILVDYLGRRLELLERTAGLVLIDPTLPNRLNVGNIRQLLDNDTLLIASQADVTSPGEIASVLLGIDKVSFSGIHGQMPAKALGDRQSLFQRHPWTDARQGAGRGGEVFSRAEVAPVKAEDLGFYIDADVNNHNNLYRFPDRTHF